jgi:hypothetical protein
MFVERIRIATRRQRSCCARAIATAKNSRSRTLANLSDWPAARIEALRRVLRDEAVAPTDHQALTLLRSLPHGHVAAALGMLRKLGLDRILSQGGRQPPP